MSPLRTIAPGVLLLLLAAAGLIYVVARPKPRLEPLPPEALLLVREEPRSTPSPVLLRTSVPKEHSTLSRRKTSPTQYAVSILSPSMAETFVAPATVTLKASADHERELETIEFYKGPTGTVCESLSPSVKFPKELKIGEVRTTPYSVQWNVRDPGIFIIRAVATYKGGEQQVSDPVVIVVKGETTPLQLQVQPWFQVRLNVPR
jgi:hypothetical protein